MGAEPEQPLLSVRELSVGYPHGSEHVRAVDGASFDVHRGERVGVVGESGSGKTTLALSLMRLLPPWAKQLSGEIVLDGQDISTLGSQGLRRIRGAEAGMVFQDPLRAFDPLRTIGYHLAEGLRAHGAPQRSGWVERASAVLRSVGMPSPREQLRRRPHELSGGMQQRSLIALGVENDPELLIADEPTTALDVTIQAQIIELFKEIGAPGPWQRMALLIVSHNVGLVRQLCTRVIVMYAGRIVEDAPVEEFFTQPRHPYGAALLAAMPKMSGARGKVTTIPGQPARIDALPTGCAFEPRCSFRLEQCRNEIPPLTQIGEVRRVACFVGQRGPLTSPNGHVDEDQLSGVDDAPHLLPANQPAVVSITGLSKRFHVRTTGLIGRRAHLRALEAVDLEINSAETLALVGESGSGKTTLARTVLGLTTPTAGTVLVFGERPNHKSSTVRRKQLVQAVFQDPHGSLNPRLRVFDIVAEPLWGSIRSTNERRARVATALDEVRLGAAFLERYPHELSGGQAQRVAIARALIADPKIIVLDEPTASLDVSIQTHVVSLLRDLQQRHGLTYLFVSHDLTAVRELATRVAVMYLGQIVEVSTAEAFFEQPLHPYAVALLSAVPRVDIDPSRFDRIVLRGEPPAAFAIPSGCPFHTRCPIAADICKDVAPPLAEHAPQRFAACHFAGTLRVGLEESRAKVS